MRCVACGELQKARLTTCFHREEVGFDFFRAAGDGDLDAGRTRGLACCVASGEGCSGANGTRFRAIKSWRNGQPGLQVNLDSDACTDTLSYDARWTALMKPLDEGYVNLAWTVPRDPGDGPGKKQGFPPPLFVHP